MDWRKLSSNSNAIQTQKELDIKNKLKTVTRILLGRNSKDSKDSKDRKKINIRDLGKDINEHITKHLEGLLNSPFRDWIPIPSKLPLKQLSANQSEFVKNLLVNANPEDLNWNRLSANPAAIEVLKKELERDKKSIKINWMNLSANTDPAAIELLSLPENFHKIYWPYLSANPAAIELLKTYQYKIYWETLSANPNPTAIELLSLPENFHKINWPYLSANPAAIELLKNNPDKINWEMLSANPAAIELIKEKLKEENNLSLKEYNYLKDSQKISWEKLSGNTNAYAIKLLKKELEKDVNSKKINWEKLSANPKAIRLLEKYKDSNKINKNILYTNPSIFIEEKIPKSSSRSSSVNYF